jgi:hypothetical protein
MTTVSEEKEVREEVPEGAAPESLRREARTCASSLTPEAATVVADVTLRAHHPYVHAAKRVVETSRARAKRAGAKTAQAANTRDSLLHSQPPTFAEAWAQHKAHAGRHEAWLITVPRHIWAVIHMTLKAVLNGLEWVTATPPRFFIAAAIITVLAIWG